MFGTSRLTKKSVTCFLHCGDEYLFVLRDANRAVDAGRLNGIGGKLHPGEDFLSCAIRETHEETGYRVTPGDCTLRAVVNLEGGYPQDWVMCFFTIRVPDTNIPIGQRNAEGKLLWLPAAEVLLTEHELVDDLHYCWQDISQGSEVLFIAARANEQEKIAEYSVQRWSPSSSG